MPFQSSLFTTQRIRIFLTLVTLLTGVYLFTYSGRIESGDTLSLFDATGSLVRYGDNYFDRSTYANLPTPETRHELYPLKESNVEPLQRLLAAALYALANQVPGFGLVHTVWLFNVFVCALAGGVLFLYGLVLGYDERTSLFAALAFGLATIVWPYSKTFFREPLAMLLIMMVALFLERLRARRYRSLPLLIGTILALVGAWLTKEAVIFALPALACIALPAIALSQRHRRAFLVLGGFATLIVLALLVAVITQPLRFYGLLTSLTQRQSNNDPQVIITALHSYLWSMGGSVWGTSPVILLVLPGLVLLYRRNQYRYIAALTVLVPAFAFGYAILRGIHWFGGLSWPPRFLIPTIPFFMLAALPVFQQILARPRRRWLIPAVAVLLAYSFWVQLSGVTLPWGAYNAALPPEAGGLSEWGGGLNEVRYLRWVLIPQQWGGVTFDFGWVRAGAPLWPVLFIALVIACIAVLVWLFRRPGVKQQRLTSLLPVALLVCIGLGLQSIYHDPLYEPVNRDALESAVSQVRAESIPGDVLLVDAQTYHYEQYFLNEAKFTVPRVISMPPQPGEQFGPDQPPRVRSDNPDLLLFSDTIPFIYNLAAKRSRLWLLVDNGPWIPYSVRPLERFLAAHYYPLREIAPAPTVRLIEYSTVNAPDPYSFRGPDNLSGLLYGGEMRLIGYNLPLGMSYSPGSVLPLSLYWTAEKPPAQDNVVAWGLLDESGGSVAQGMDSPPVAGFSLTLTWVPGAPVWDNRALRLPSDIPAGKYRLWLRVYYWEAGTELRLLTVDGDRMDDTTGLLPGEVEVRSRG
jgi:hypothetical protein